MNIFLKLKTIFARQSSAPTEAAQKDKQQIATEARDQADQAAQALNAEAQAVVDRIRERTISVSVDTKALSTDLNQVEADYKDGRLTAHEAATKIVAATKKSRSVKATLTDASGTVVPLKPARKRKPKGGQ